MRCQQINNRYIELCKGYGLTITVRNCNVADVPKYEISAFAGEIGMQSKNNKQLVPLAKQMRKERTKEERHLRYVFLQSYPVRFPDNRCCCKTIPQSASLTAPFAQGSLRSTLLHNRKACIAPIKMCVVFFFQSSVSCKKADTRMGIRLFG